MSCESEAQSCASSNPLGLNDSLEAMEYTDVLSLQQMTQLFLQNKVVVKPVAILEASAQELIAPVTKEGRKILFELSVDQFHNLSEEHDFTLRAAHETTEAMGAPLHITLEKEAAEALDAVDDSVKDLLRSRNDDAEAYGTLPECPIWNHMVKESPSEKKVISAEMVLEGSEAPSNLMFLKPDSTLVEGTGIQFLTGEIGHLQNLKDYSCNPILELAWILHREAEGGHRLRMKVHSVMFKKKVKAGLASFKMNSRKVAALVEGSRLTKLKVSF